MKKPNFFIIGSVKCGTTTLYSYLKKSPEVFLPVIKEPHFFITCSNDLDYEGPRDNHFFNKYPTDINKYEALFNEADTEKVIGEASAMYMYFPNVAEHLYNYSPNAKIIGIIRNPIDRAYSHYLHQVRDGMETADSFYDALTEELEGKRERWAPQRRYIDFGRYSTQLQRYYKVFPKDQIKIFKFENFVSNPNETLGEISSYLGINNIFQDMKIDKHNVSGIPIYKNIHYSYIKVRRLVRKVAPFLTNSRIAIIKRKVEKYYQNKFLKKPQMCLQSKKLLQEIYLEEIKAIENISELNVNDWVGDTLYEQRH